MAVSEMDFIWHCIPQALFWVGVKSSYISQSFYSLWIFFWVGCGWIQINKYWYAGPKKRSFPSPSLIRALENLLHHINEFYERVARSDYIDHRFNNLIEPTALLPYHDEASLGALHTHYKLYKICVANKCQYNLEWKHLNLDSLYLGLALT